MPLSDGYGVVIGTISDYYRDQPDNFGKYYHGNIKVNTPAGIYHCAIDVDSHQSEVGVQWRTVTLTESDLSQLLSLDLGFHFLSSNSTSGAIDYIRSPKLKIKPFFLRLSPAIIRFIKIFLLFRRWKSGQGVDALTDLEPYVYATKNNGLKVLIFGEPFTYGGLGVHNIHQNQGDPITSQWAGENGIWQDGCTILQQPNNTFVAFLNKFSTQSNSTDDQGHPA